MSHNSLRLKSNYSWIGCFLPVRPVKETREKNVIRSHYGNKNSGTVDQKLKVTDLIQWYETDPYIKWNQYRESTEGFSMWKVGKRHDSIKLGKLVSIFGAACALVFWKRVKRAKKILQFYYKIWANSGFTTPDLSRSRAHKPTCAPHISESAGSRVSAPPSTHLLQLVAVDNDFHCAKWMLLRQ